MTPLPTGREDLLGGAFVAGPLRTVYHTTPAKRNHTGLMLGLSDTLQAAKKAF